MGYSALVYCNTFFRAAMPGDANLFAILDNAIPQCNNGIKTLYFFMFYMRFPHSIQAFMRFWSIFGLLWIYYLDYFGSNHAGYSIYKRSFLKSFDPKSGFLFLREIFFLNFVRCEKSCFSVTLPQFSGDLTCLHCLLRHVCLNTVLFQIQSKYSYCSR